MSPECQSLIQQLLNSDYTKRLGAHGVEEIKVHPFFLNKIDWINLRKQKAPLIPSPLDLNEILKSNQNEENRNIIFKENQSQNQEAKEKLSQQIKSLVRLDLLASMNDKLANEIINEKEQVEGQLEKLWRNEQKLKEKIKRCKFSQIEQLINF